MNKRQLPNPPVSLHSPERPRHEFCRNAGMTFRQLQEDGVDPVLRRVEIDYLTPLRLGEEFMSRLTLARHGARFVFHQEIYRLPDMAPVVKADATIVCLEGGRLTRGDILAEAFADHLQ